MILTRRFVDLNWVAMNFGRMSFVNLVLVFQRMQDEFENRSIFFPVVLTEIFPKPLRKRNSDNCGVFYVDFDRASTLK